MMAWWKRFGRRAATLLLTVLMLLGTAAGEGADKTVINRINAPDVSADFAFAEDADLLEIIFPQILDCDAAFLRCGGETMLIDCATSGQARRILTCSSSWASPMWTKSSTPTRTPITSADSRN